MLRKEKIAHLRDSCSEARVRCTNDGCKKAAKRKDLQAHIEQCEERLVECPFAKFDCTVTRIKAKQLSAHLDAFKFDHISRKFDAITTQVLCLYIALPTRIFSENASFLNSRC